ncbi:MAG: HDIG domain-containing protein [Nitrospiraceae bacterium]|nr:MAG: HDIG domain-containing protein [Nitrospiraceae bacterium]
MKNMKNGIPLDKNSGSATKPFLLNIFCLCVIALIVSTILITDLRSEQIIGGSLISFVLLIIFFRDIMRYRPLYMNNYNMLFLLTLMILSTLILGRSFEYIFLILSDGLGFIVPETAMFGLPLAAGAMLVTLLFDFHTAITFSFIISLLSGYWLLDAFYPIYVFVGSLTAAFSVIRCKKRSAILLGGLYIILANVLMVLIICLTKGELFSPTALSALILAIISGIIVSAIVSLLLPFLEYLFKITTDISLLELLDLNQPLMKNLMVTAPGTYHHSIIVGNLVESAAEVVNVNPLLARVSSYYHDIGKLKMPDYFVENQIGTENKHDKLTPHMSSMIITNHVKEGVELAKQFKLPDVIINIIKEHHGTSVMTYFYQKAKELEQPSIPEEEEYRYLGPKPQSRVSALVMMADAIEAASRVLNDPTPSRISALVDKIMNNFFIDGQLDECELTFKDISEIKKRFIYILTSIFHKRIDYPGFDFSEQGLHNKPAKNEKAEPSENNKGSQQDSSASRVSKS